MQDGTNYARSGATIRPAANFNGTLTVPVLVNDGAADSNIFNLSVTVTAVNDVPIVMIETETLTYRPGDGAVVLNSTFSVIGADDNAIASAVIAISENYQAEEDFLDYTETHGIASAYVDGVLFLSGIASIEAYRDALRAVAYRNSDGTPTRLERTVAVTVTDPAGLSSAPATMTIAFLLTLPHALAFDGVDDSVELPATVADLSDGFTVEFWLNPVASGPILELGNGNAGDTISLFQPTSTNDISLEILRGTTSGGIVTAANLLRSGEWQHLAVTVGYEGDVIFYHSGVEAAVGSSGVMPRVVERTQNYIGRTTGTSISFAGQLDELRIWTTPRSAAEVLDNYHVDLSVVPPTLAAYFSFDEAAEQIFADRTAHHAAAIRGTTAGVDAGDPASVRLTTAIVGGTTRTVIMDEDGFPRPFSLNLELIDPMPLNLLNWSFALASGDGTASIDTNNQMPEFSYIPAENFNGSDTFEILVDDRLGESTTLSVNVKIRPQNDPPVNSVRPSISGTPEADGTLTANPGSWHDINDLVPGTISYLPQWEVADENNALFARSIAGAETFTLALTGDYVGRYIRVKVIAMDDGEGRFSSGVAVAYSEFLLIGATPLFTGTPLVGDANRDGIVNMEDFGILVSHWLLTCNGSEWEDPTAESVDFNGDCKVDIFDYSILVQNWLKTVDAAP